MIRIHVDPADPDKYFSPGDCVRLTVFPAEERLVLWFSSFRAPGKWRCPYVLTVPGLAIKPYRLFVTLLGASVTMLPHPLWMGDDDCENLLGGPTCLTPIHNTESLGIRNTAVSDNDSIAAESPQAGP
jgi:hypothetical protein